MSSPLSIPAREIRGAIGASRAFTKPLAPEIVFRIDENFTPANNVARAMLLFLPGLICDARTYAQQLAAFPESRAIDGYGQVDTLEGMARVVLEQAPESFDLFGHSMGGRVALEVFRLAPERVRRIALSSTGVHSLRPTEPANRHALQALGHERGFDGAGRHLAAADGRRAQPREARALRADAADEPRGRAGGVRRADQRAAHPARAGEPAAADRVPGARS